MGSRSGSRRKSISKALGEFRSRLRSRSRSEETGSEDVDTQHHRRRASLVKRSDTMHSSLGSAAGRVLRSPQAARRGSEYHMDRQDAGLLGHQALSRGW